MAWIGLDFEAMDGVHDCGGMHGLGAIEHDGGASPPFHEVWEGRMHAMMLALAAAGHRKGSLRYGIESMGPTYLTTSYYEHWLFSVERSLNESGLVPAGTLEARIAEGRLAAAQATSDQALAATIRARLTQAFRRPMEGPPPALRVGQQVRVDRYRTSHDGHTRCPRYVRGIEGVIERICPHEAFPEGLPLGEVTPMACYTVRFASTDIWGPDAEAFSLSVDLMERYLNGLSR